MMNGSASMSATADPVDQLNNSGEDDDGSEFFEDHIDDNSMPRIVSVTDTDEVELGLGEFTVKITDNLYVKASSNLDSQLRIRASEPHFAEAWRKCRQKNSPLSVPVKTVEGRRDQTIGCIGCRAAVKEYIDLMNKARSEHNRMLGDIILTENNCVALADTIFSNEDLTRYRICFDRHFVGGTKRNGRCDIHRQDTETFENSDDRFWMSAWGAVPLDCKEQLMAFKEGDVRIALDTHLQSLCQRCRTAVNDAYEEFKEMLWNRANTDAFYTETGYDPIIFEGLTYCDSTGEVTVSHERDYLNEIINFARREAGRTERHAESKEKAQTEIVIMMGKFVWQRLNAVYQKLETKERGVLVTYELLSFCLLEHLLRDIEMQKAEFNAEQLLHEEEQKKKKKKKGKSGSAKKGKGKKAKQHQHQQQQQKQQQQQQNQQKQQKQQQKQQKQGQQPKQQKPPKGKQNKPDPQKSGRREDVQDPRHADQRRHVSSTATSGARGVSAETVAASWDSATMRGATETHVHNSAAAGSKGNGRSGSGGSGDVMLHSPPAGHTAAAQGHDGGGRKGDGGAGIPEAEGARPRAEAPSQHGSHNANNVHAGEGNDRSRGAYGDLGNGTSTGDDGGRSSEDGRLQTAMPPRPLCFLEVEKKMAAEVLLSNTKDDSILQVLEEEPEPDLKESERRLLVSMGWENKLLTADEISHLWLLRHLFKHLLEFEEERTRCRAAITRRFDEFVSRQLSQVR